MEVITGIDIGGTLTKIGLVDRKGRIVFKSEISSREYPDPEDFIAAINKEVTTALQEDMVLKGIGVGAPNGNYFTGAVEFAPNLAWKGVVPLADMFQRSFGVKVVLTNDASAAAYGEMLFGDARDLDNFIMITLGTGLGSGLMVDGHMVYGHDGFAGELGHVRAVDNGRQCGCGKRGCLETYVSATGIKRTVFELMASENLKSDFRDIPFSKLKPKLITAMAEKGDPIAIKAFERTGWLLGRSLADAVAYLSPSDIFLFGGLAKAGKWIIDPAKRSMEEHLLPVYKDKVTIRPSALLHKNIAILGAAALAWKATS